MDKELQFINTYIPLASELEKKFNIPVMVSLAQSALETGWGINKPGNMMFGIKAGNNWNGSTQKLLTTEILTANEVKKLKSYHSISRTESGKYKVKLYQVFRSYDNPKQSFYDYAKLLTELPRYKTAFQFSDPYKFAYEIAKSGYSTSSNYYNALKNIIDRIKKKAISKKQSNLQLVQA